MSEVSRIDISEPVQQICELLGVSYNRTAWIYIDPTTVVTNTYETDEKGTMIFDMATNSVVKKTEVHDVEHGAVVAKRITTHEVRT